MKIKFKVQRLHAGRMKQEEMNHAKITERWRACDGGDRGDGVTKCKVAGVCNSGWSFHVRFRDTPSDRVPPLPLLSLASPSLPNSRSASWNRCSASRRHPSPLPQPLSACPSPAHMRAESVLISHVGGAILLVPYRLMATFRQPKLCKQRRGGPVPPPTPIPRMRFDPCR